MDSQRDDLTRQEIERIHAASLECLRTSGVSFGDMAALGAFTRAGAPVDGHVVRIPEATVEAAIRSAPGSFTLRSRNDRFDVEVGGAGLCCAPGLAARFLTGGDGAQRPATMGDHDSVCKLVQSSDQIDLIGLSTLIPYDLPSSTGHLDQLFSCLVLSDKPLFVGTLTESTTRDALEMVAILWGGEAGMRRQPVLLGQCSPSAPLSYSADAAASLMHMARCGQAVVFTGSPMPLLPNAHSSERVVAARNAEVLAGIVLAQLIRPGAPVVYGTSLPQVFASTDGSETFVSRFSQLAATAARMGGFYGIPSCSGGALTQSRFVDAQAGMESALTLSKTVSAGVHLVVHAFGVLGSLGMLSLDKLIADEYLCRAVRSLRGSQERAHWLAANVGWRREAASSMDRRVAAEVEERLARFEKPEIDADHERALFDFVSLRRKALAA